MSILLTQELVEAGVLRFLNLKTEVRIVGALRISGLHLRSTTDHVAEVALEQASLHFGSQSLDQNVYHELFPQEADDVQLTVGSALANLSYDVLLFVRFPLADSAEQVRQSNKVAPVGKSRLLEVVRVTFPSPKRAIDDVVGEEDLQAEYGEDKEAYQALERTKQGTDVTENL